MIKLEIDLHSAAAVREALFTATKGYTYDLTCVPKRVVDIRDVIVELDNQIEEELKNETTDT